MQIAVNGRGLARRLTGVERYTQELLSCLARQRPPGELRVIRPGRARQGLSGHAWEQFALPGLLRPGEMLWSPANTGPLAVSPQALTLHDLGPLEHPEWYAPAFACWYRLLLPLLVRRARQVLAPSEYIRRRVLHRFGLPAGRVRVIPGGVDGERFNPQAPRLAGLPARYVLFVGSLQPRKNLGLLLRAWEQIQPRHPDAWLLLAGETGSAFRQIARPSLSASAGRVRWLGYVAEDNLPGLYAGAQACVLPSLDEGFGLPVLEAMACGCPVLAAAAGALPEVGGDAALWFDPANSDELAGLLERCLSEPGLRRSLAEQGLARSAAFGWQRPAEQLWESWQT